MSYNVESVEKRGPLIQLKASKIRIKDLFNDILDETKVFSNQITLKAVLKKYKSTETEFSSVYFNSTTKTMINHKFDLDKSFQDN